MLRIFTYSPMHLMAPIAGVISADSVKKSHSLRDCSVPLHTTSVYSSISGKSTNCGIAGTKGRTSDVEIGKPARYVEENRGSSNNTQKLNKHIAVMV